MSVEWNYEFTETLRWLFLIADPLIAVFILLLAVLAFRQIHIDLNKHKV